MFNLLLAKLLISYWSGSQAIRDQRENRWLMVATREADRVSDHAISVGLGD